MKFTRREAAAEVEIDHQLGTGVDKASGKGLATIGMAETHLEDGALVGENRINAS